MSAAESSGSALFTVGSVAITTGRRPKAAVKDSTAYTRRQLHRFRSSPRTAVMTAMRYATTTNRPTDHVADGSQPRKRRQAAARIRVVTPAAIYLLSSGLLSMSRPIRIGEQEVRQGKHHFRPRRRKDAALRAGSVRPVATGSPSACRPTSSGLIAWPSECWSRTAADGCRTESSGCCILDASLSGTRLIFPGTPLSAL